MRRKRRWMGCYSLQKSQFSVFKHTAQGRTHWKENFWNILLFASSIPFLNDGVDCCINMINLTLKCVEYFKIYTGVSERKLEETLPALTISVWDPSETSTNENSTGRSIDTPNPYDHKLGRHSPNKIDDFVLGWLTFKCVQIKLQLRDGWNVCSQDFKVISPAFNTKAAQYVRWSHSRHTRNRHRPWRGQPTKLPGLSGIYAQPTLESRSPQPCHHSLLAFASSTHKYIICIPKPNYSKRTLITRICNVCTTSNTRKVKSAGGKKPVLTSTTQWNVAQCRRITTNLFMETPPLWSVSISHPKTPVPPRAVVPNSSDTKFDT